MSKSDSPQAVAERVIEGAYPLDTMERIQPLLAGNITFGAEACTAILKAMPDDTSSLQGATPSLIDGVASQLYGLLFHVVRSGFDVGDLGPHLSAGLDLARVTCGVDLPSERRTAVLRRVLSQRGGQPSALPFVDESGTVRVLPLPQGIQPLLDRLGPDGEWQHLAVTSGAHRWLAPNVVTVGFQTARIEDLGPILNENFIWTAALLAHRKDSAEELAALARQTKPARARVTALFWALSRSDGELDVSDLTDDLSFSDVDHLIYAKCERVIGLLGDDVLAATVTRSLRAGDGGLRATLSLCCDAFPPTAVREMTDAIESSEHLGWEKAGECLGYHCAALFDDVIRRLEATDDLEQKRQLSVFLIGAVAGSTKTPEHIDAYIDVTAPTPNDTRRLFAAIAALPTDRAERVLVRCLDERPMPFKALTAIREGMSESFSREIAKRIAARHTERDLLIGVGANLVHLGDAFGDHLREAMGDVPLRKGLLDDMVLTHGARQRLTTARPPEAQSSLIHIEPVAGGDMGWESGSPPAISAAQWPRHRRSGLPLMHGFTIRLPEAYRTKGPERVAVSYFHPGDSESYPLGDVQPRIADVLAGGALEGDEEAHPFWCALEAYAQSVHPARVLYDDVLDHTHALIWHTESELSAKRCPMPITELPVGSSREAMHFDDFVDADEAGEPLGIVAESTRGFITLGWPPAPVQSDPEDLTDIGFSESVLEIETDVGGVNYGDGNCQICLENDLLDWACT